MPKIKKFNLKLSAYNIQQHLRREKILVTETTLLDIKTLSDELKEKITPAVFYQSTKAADVFAELPADAVAMSIVASTVGHPAEEFINRYNGSDKYAVAKAVLYQAIDETKKFAWKLIAEEASDEKCVLTEKSEIKEYEKLDRLKDVLSKIDVYPSHNGLVPAYSFVEIAFWIPVKKQKSKN